MALSFVFDEHLRGLFVQVIARHAVGLGFRPEIVQVGEPADLPTGTSDPLLLRWAEQNQRIIITQDRPTMIHHFR